MGGSRSPGWECRPDLCSGECPGSLYIVLLELNIFCKLAKFFGPRGGDSFSCRSSNASAIGRGLLGGGGGVSSSSAIFECRRYVRT